MEFYNRIDLSTLFAREHELSNLIADNPDVVAEWIGRDNLILVGREQPFAAVRSDIVFTTGEERVEVEVQLGPADDSHMGEILRHVTQRESDVFVWVAQSFDRQMNRIARRLNGTEWHNAGAPDFYTVEIYGIEGTDLLGWDVIEQPYTLDRDVDAERGE